MADSYLWWSFLGRKYFFLYYSYKLDNEVWGKQHLLLFCLGAIPGSAWAYSWRSLMGGHRESHGGGGLGVKPGMDSMWASTPPTILAIHLWRKHNLFYSRTIYVFVVWDQTHLNHVFVTWAVFLI